MFLSLFPLSQACLDDNNEWTIRFRNDGAMFKNFSYDSSPHEAGSDRDWCNGQPVEAGAASG